jgi:hypothetical protein
VLVLACTKEEEVLAKLVLVCTKEEVEALAVLVLACTKEEEVLAKLVLVCTKEEVEALAVLVLVCTKVFVLVCAVLVVVSAGSKTFRSNIRLRSCARHLRCRTPSARLRSGGHSSSSVSAEVGGGDCGVSRLLGWVEIPQFVLAIAKQIPTPHIELRIACTRERRRMHEHIQHLNSHIQRDKERVCVYVCL